MGAVGVLTIIGFSVGVFFLYRKMARAGSPLFKIGYFLYTRTFIGNYYFRQELAKARRKNNNQPHSVTQPTSINGLQILPIAFSMDNYSYLVTDEQSSVSVLIDPADHEAVQVVLDREKVSPAAILTTHKHWDHSGGNKHWKRKYRNIPIYGGATDHVPSATHGVHEGDRLQFGHLSFTVRLTPGHTSGHVVYVLDGASFGAPTSLFSGDHLFLGGIGRLFEGSASTMLSSLDNVCQLPEDTLIWPGHEYAVDNLEFAEHVDPENEAIKVKRTFVNNLRKNKQSTCPSTLGEEKQYNPYLRTSDPKLQTSLKVDPDTPRDQLRQAVLAKCRAAKDQFKYKL